MHASHQITKRCFIGGTAAPAIRHAGPMAASISILLLGFAVTGCGSSGPPRTEVEGTVTVNGQPLKSGQISFVGRGPKIGPAAGAEIKDGTFYISEEKGPFPGEYQVQIRAFQRTGKFAWDGMGDPHVAGFEKNMVEELEQYIPPQFNSLSTLRATLVVDDANKLSFDLQIPQIAQSP